MTREALDAATAVLVAEAAALDEQRWDDWLAMYQADCEYWAPCWKEDHTLTGDPGTELSHVYYSGRAGLEDRVWRIRSRRSPASSPMPRTARIVGNVRVVDESATRLEVRSTWVNHVYSLRSLETQVLFGRTEHMLRRSEGANDAWLIARKKIVLLNDRIATYIDIYHL
jgi:3-phenylpropionate/cinnamic acid dioxygenase small subunit